MDSLAVIPHLDVLEEVLLGLMVALVGLVFSGKSEGPEKNGFSSL